MGRPPQDPAEAVKRDQSSRTQGFDKDQPSEPAGGPNPDRYRKATTPSFDDGEAKPAAIESTGHDGVRAAPPKTPASDRGPRRDDHSTEATLPPGQDTGVDRNTM